MPKRHSDQSKALAFCRQKFGGGKVVALAQKIAPHTLVKNKREAWAIVFAYAQKYSPTPLVFTPRRGRPSRKDSRTSAEFLDSWEWTTLRMSVIKSRGRRCECCGWEAKAVRPDGTVVCIHVDHIKPRSKFPELALDESNLQVLCNTCNKGKGNWDETDWRPEAVTVDIARPHGGVVNVMTESEACRIWNTTAVPRLVKKANG